ncbi:MAG: 7-carboxy-7-deazaguanine synthase QueE [Phycisphaerae bacterium]|jgi:7-carboxy-7-deazaguanine synthase
MNNPEIKITELFYSIQGEGLLAGKPSVFVRLAGCPLRCKFCDTVYSQDANAGKKISLEKIINEIKKYSCDYVVITGGEPIANLHIVRLCEEIKKLERHITIETNGIKFIENLRCDLMSVSPKLSNAYENPADREKFLKIDSLQKLIDNYNYQLKFVIDKREDIIEVRQLLKKLKNIDIAKVLLMPQAKNIAEYLNKCPLIAELCKENNFTFCPRLQLEFGETSITRTPIS